jgi:predicted N-acetyltransferase YhbS
MLEIDQISNEDLYGLKELYEDSFEGKTDYEKMKETFRKITNDPNYIILIAREDNKIVGSVLGVICYELIGESTPFMVLEDVAVLKQYRRKGIARQLLQKIEDQARLKKCNMILFVSSIHREGAHKLYESLGYGMDKVNGYRKRLQ